MLDRLIQMIAERSFQMSDTPSFKLASGKLSNYYVNCRLVTIDPEGMHLIGNMVYDRISDSGIDAIGGPSLGAVPIVDAVSMTAYQKGKYIKPFYVREQAKDHGIGKKIEGNIKTSNSGGKVNVSIDNAVSYPAAIHQGDVLTAVATEERRTRRLGFYRATVTNQSGETVALFRGTVFQTDKDHRTD